MLATRDCVECVNEEVLPMGEHQLLPQAFDLVRCPGAGLDDAEEVLLYGAGQRGVEEVVRVCYGVRLTPCPDVAHECVALETPVATRASHVRAPCSIRVALDAGATAWAWLREAQHVERGLGVVVARDGVHGLVLERALAVHQGADFAQRELALHGVNVMVAAVLDLADEREDAAEGQAAQLLRELPKVSVSHIALLVGVEEAEYRLDWGVIGQESLGLLDVVVELALALDDGEDRLQF
mmetsp:Transcript_84493/g.247834  ORF Transcript_84493/g.247834 Transcript_84493/m.247834 type:complete len:239 (+) Transcript_84493:219-935(+)